MDDKKLIEDSLAQDAMGSLIHQARKDGIGITDVLWAAGYRLDPYPNGKSKDELLAIIEQNQADLYKMRVFLQSAFYGLTDGHTKESVGKFLDDTSLVKP